MKPIKPLLFVGLLIPISLVLQSCYTQLAVSKRVIVEKHTVRQPDEPVFSENVTDTLETYEEQTTSIVHEYHYWFADPSCRWFGYEPGFNDPGFHFSFYYSWGDPYWDPWYYSYYRPYRWRPYYAGWYWYDPYWGDPYYYGYYGGYYSGYWDPYWGWYGPGYFGDIRPKKKRDWERRGANLTDGTIVRTGAASGSQNNNTLNNSVNLVTAIQRTDPETRVVENQNRKPERTVRRTDSAKKVRRTDNNKHNTKNRSMSISRRIYKQIERSVSRSGDRKRDDHNRSGKSKRVSSRKNTGGTLKDAVSKSVKRVTSRSYAKKQSKSRSSGSDKSRPSKKRTSGDRKRH